MQAGGNAPVGTSKQATLTPATSPAVTPPPANVPRKAQVGRPAKIVKPKAPQAAGPKKTTPLKPPVTRSKTKNQPIPTNVSVTDPEDDTTAPVSVEYDTDELAELPTDSEPKAVESEPGEETAQIEKQ